MNEILTTIAILLLLVFGIILVINSFRRPDCPVQTTKYLFVPRTFEEEQNDPVKVSDVFKSLFEQQSILP
jgi:hypothetical protein